MASVLITSERQEPLASLLRDRGLHVIHEAFVTRMATKEEPPVGRPDCVLVTSSAVARFKRDLVNHIGHGRVVAVGESTARSLAAIGVTVHTVGDSGGVEAFRLLELQDREVCWYVGAERPSQGLLEVLESAEVRRWSVYRTLHVEAPNALATDRADVVCFTSGSAATSYARAFGVPTCAVAVLGMTTADVAQNLGMRVSAVAERPTLEALADAIMELT